MSEEIDFQKLKVWWEVRKSKAAKRKKWAWPVLIIYALIIAYFLVAKFGCTWHNEGNYDTERIFFFDKLGYKCLPMNEYDNKYMNGDLKKCLDISPNSDLYKCNIPTIDPGGFTYEGINFTFQKTE